MGYYPRPGGKVAEEPMFPVEEPLALLSTRDIVFVHVIDLAKTFAEVEGYGSLVDGMVDALAAGTGEPIVTDLWCDVGIPGVKPQLRMGEEYVSIVVDDDGPKMCFGGRKGCDGAWDFSGCRNVKPFSVPLVLAIGVFTDKFNLGRRVFRFIKWIRRNRCRLEPCTNHDP